VAQPGMAMVSFKRQRQQRQQQQRRLLTAIIASRDRIARVIRDSVRFVSTSRSRVSLCLSSLVVTMITESYTDFTTALIGRNTVVHNSCNF
jgi:hypothetical protein